MAQNIESELQKEVSRLPSAQQRKVLDFAQSLASQQNGGAGQALLQHAGRIESDDLEIMKQAIEAGCETVNSDEW